MPLMAVYFEFFVIPHLGKTASGIGMTVCTTPRSKELRQMAL